MKNENQNIANFVDHKLNTKSGIQEAIKKLTALTNKYKYDYPQLKYIFRVVRHRCNIEVPSNSKKLIELPTKDELDSFYESINNPMHKLIFEFMESTGVRVSELVNLEVKRLNLNNNLGFIKDGKGGKDRMIVIPDNLKDKLDIYLNGKNHRYVFESKQNTKFSTRRIQQLCKTFREMSGIKAELTCHTFRHIYFTRLAELGVSQEKRALLAGHSNQKTQEIYTHMGVDGIKNEVMLALKKVIE